MATYYWVGGSGAWNSSNTANWSATSGGSGGAGIPTSADDVYFNTASNSTAYTVSIGSSVVCNNLTIGPPNSGNITILDNGNTITFYASLTTSATGITSTQTGGFVAAAPAQTYVGIATYNNSAFASTPLTINGGNGAGTSGTYSYPTDYGATGLVFNPNFTGSTVGSVKFDGTAWTNGTGANSLTSKQNGGTFSVFMLLSGGGYANITITLTSNWSQAGALFTASYSSSQAVYPTFPVSITSTGASVQAGNIQITSDVTFGNVVVGNGNLTVRARTLTCANLTINNATGGLYNGLNVQYSTINVSGNYSVPAALTNSSISLSDTGIAPWGPVVYNTSFISNAFIRTSVVGQPNTYDIVMVFNSAAEGAGFQSLFNQNSQPYANTLSGTMRNNVGTGLFTGAGAVGSWIDFTVLKGNTNTMQQESPTQYYTTINYFPNTTFSLVATNSASTSPSVTTYGGGSSIIALTGATSSFNGGPNITYPNITFKSTAAHTTPHLTTSTSNNYKTLGYVYSVGTLAIEGPSTDGYTVIATTGGGATFYVTKALQINAGSSNQLRRVLWLGVSPTETYGNNQTVYPANLNLSDGVFATVSDTDFNHTTISGGTITQSGSRVVNLGSSTVFLTNFAFSTPRTLYWSGASGGTITANTTNWSTTDGGAPTAGLMPLAHDYMTFTNNALNSGATLTVSATDMPLGYLDFGSRSNPVTLNLGSVDLYSYNSVTLSNSVTMTASAGFLYFVGYSSTLITYNIPFTKAIAINMLGTLGFGSNFTSNVSYATQAVPSISLLKGQLSTNGITINTRDFGSGGYPTALAKQPRTIYSNSSTSFNLVDTGTNSYIWYNINCENFSNGGYSTKVNLNSTGYSGIYRYIYNENPTDPGFGNTIDLNILTTTTYVALSGAFGTIDNTSSTMTAPYRFFNMFGRVVVRDAVKVLDGTSFSTGNYFYLHPRTPASTVSVTTNWVYGQGAIGTAGSFLGSIVIGKGSITTRDGSAGTVIFTTPFTANSLDVESAHVTFSNVTASITNFQTQYAIYYPRTITFINSTLINNGTSPVFFQGTSVTCVYDSSSKIQVTGVYTYPSSVNIGNNVPGCTLPHIEIKTTSVVTASSIVVDKLTMTGGQTLKITSSYTVAVNNFNINGTLANPVVIYGDGGPVTKANIVKNGGYMDLTGVTISDVAFSGTATKRAWQSTANRVTGITVKLTKKQPESSFLSLC